MLYVVKSGCQWWMLPRDFPPWKTVYSYFRRLCHMDIWETVLQYIVKVRPLKKILADLCYRGLRIFEEVVSQIHSRFVEFLIKIVGQFVIQLKRWVVEHAFAWLNHYRRLSKDCEISTKSAENIIMIAHKANLLRQVLNVSPS